MENIISKLKKNFFGKGWLIFICLSFFSLTVNHVTGQTTTYTASPSSWTITPSKNATCQGTLLGKNIRDRVTILGNKATFEVSKVNGNFTSNGTVFIKDSYCGNIIKSQSFLKGETSIFISIPLSHSSESKNYVITLNSSTTDKFYTEPIAITAKTTLPVSLSAFPTNLSFPASGSTQSITISTNADYKISGTVPGFTITATASNKISVTAASNESTQIRGGSFIIIAGTGTNSKTQSIALTQDGKTPPQVTLTATPTSLSFPASGSTQNITISTNADYKISGTVPGFTITATASNKISVTAASNVSTQTRGGSFNIIAGTGTNSKTQSIALTQDGKTPPQVTLTATPTNLSFPASGSTQNITISTNADYKISGTVPGFTITATASNKISVIAASNESTQTRGGSFNIIAGTGTNSKTQSIALTQAGKTPQDFKIIGYLPTYQWGITKKSNYLEMLTHVNLSFINPKIAWNSKSKQYEVQYDSRGNVALTFDNTSTITDENAVIRDLKIVRSLISKQNLKIYLSFGGAVASQPNGLLKTYRHLLTTPNLRQAFINGLLNYVEENGIDGIDVDLEYLAMILPNYNVFVQELSKACKAKNKGITAAYETKWVKCIDENNSCKNDTVNKIKDVTKLSASTLNSLDWINVMSYDEEEDQHASEIAYLSHFTFWNSTKNIVPSKIVMGLPFYGRVPLKSRGNSNPEIPFFDIYKTLASNKTKNYATNIYDSYLNKIHPKVYYNGTNLISTKTKSARTNKCSGVMIWSIGSDMNSDINNSLLKAIYDSIVDNKTSFAKEEPIELPSRFVAYPNPVNSTDWIEFNKPVSFEIYAETTNSLVISSQEIVNGFNISKLSSGSYIIKTHEGQTFRIVKQ
ncbi:glycosyl hydrolase family 18 protein [Emticicia sp. 21SJ11W-3]|uniref:glycosyl hydrolase family 18 protein n=1 Tax=Emticicia sp. 21SJ11W-3 TaxID=2916755 RepID=UPI00209EA92F|nr:glycosyl hydrolase family 18 protein [Emticicia sp. 21SJ11W-3]UTA67804.1 glycosyl hydrolase family 18 protein [Emticicia sp. 21SJ11W-3]